MDSSQEYNANQNKYLLGDDEIISNICFRNDKLIYKKEYVPKDDYYKEFWRIDHEDEEKGEGYSIEIKTYMLHYTDASNMNNIKENCKEIQYSGKLIYILKSGTSVEVIAMFKKTIEEIIEELETIFTKFFE